VHELGVRVALGGSRLDVFRLVLSRGVRLVAAGMAIGLPAAFGVTRLLSSRLVAVTHADPGSYVGTAVLVTALGLAGCAVPAWRATRVDPVVALKGE
jgi:putative ABC transport system permease protein